MAHYINKFWQDGLIDPDFQTKDYDTSVAFMSNERVAGNIGTWWHNYTGGYQVWMSTSDDYNPEKRMQELTWEETDATPNLISDNYIRTTRLIITDKAEHPEEIVTYWNWQQSPLAIAFNSMGPQGEDMAWVIDEDGNAKIDDRYWYGRSGQQPVPVGRLRKQVRQLELRHGEPGLYAGETAKTIRRKAGLLRLQPSTCGTSFRTMTKWIRINFPLTR